MLKKLKQCKSIALVALMMVMMSSCQDGRIAKQADGCWHYGLTTTFDDGSKTETDIYLLLAKFEDIDGGRFMESTVSSAMYYDYEGNAYNVPYRTNIRGWWEIVAGDMHLEYEIETLKVAAYQDDIKMDLGDDPFVQAYVSQMYSGFEGALDILYSRVAESFNKEMYTEMFHLYSLDNECDYPYSNVEVAGSTLSFESIDFGRVVCDKYEGDMPGMELLKSDNNYGE